MDDDTNVHVSHPHLLKVLREETPDSGKRDTGPRERFGHAESGNGRDVRDTDSTSGSYTGVTGGAQRAGTDNNTSNGLHQRVRQADGPGVNTVESTNRSGQRSKRIADVPKEDAPKVNFTLKNPFKRDKGPTKLFTKAEADAEYEKMYTIYFQGSGLLDDILEIVVKDHEPVEIWQLSDDEATMLTTMHLERAQYDESAARSARQLLALYDRLYMWIVVAPRAKATVTHVKIHGGFSFR